MTIDVAVVKRGAFQAHHVVVDAPGKQPHRHLHHIESILDAADLSAGVRGRAREVFARLAAAEAEVHGTTIQKVHFHEVGAVNAIVDIVGALVGARCWGMDEVRAGTLPLGGGTVMWRARAHSGARARDREPVARRPVVMGPVEAELVTPTGAALLSTLVRDWRGHRRALERTATRHGTREFAEQANVLRLLIGETLAAAGGAGREVAVLETAVDDESRNPSPRSCPGCWPKGRSMPCWRRYRWRKGRPGTWLVVVSEPTKSEHLAAVILAETNSLGVRVHLSDGSS